MNRSLLLSVALAATFTAAQASEYTKGAHPSGLHPASGTAEVLGSTTPDYILQAKALEKALAELAEGALEPDAPRYDGYGYR